MISLKLTLTGMLLGLSLFLGAGEGRALMSPDHYQKMKKQNSRKTEDPEKVQPRVPVKIRAERPGQGLPPAGKAGPK